MIECRICLEDSTNEQLISPCGCDGTAKWVEFNKKWSEQWPVITEKKEPLPDAEKDIMLSRMKTWPALKAEDLK